MPEHHLGPGLHGEVHGLPGVYGVWGVPVAVCLNVGATVSVITMGAGLHGEVHGLPGAPASGAG